MCMFIHVCMYVYIYIYIYMYMCMYIHTYHNDSSNTCSRSVRPSVILKSPKHIVLDTLVPGILMRVTCTRLYTICVYLYIYIYVHTYIHIYICIYIYIYNVYTDMYIQL